MGKVLDVAIISYLGRIFVGLNPKSANFDDLPPYFKKVINDDVIKQGMACIYGNLLTGRPNSVSILILCFARVIYPFSTLPVLQDEELLEKLKRLVTRELPPNIIQLKILDSIKTKFKDITDQFTQQSGQIIQTVRDTIFANDLQSGTLNLATLENRLNEHTNSVEKIIEKVLETRSFNQSTTMAQ